MEDALRYSEYRGMNLFAALALASIVRIQDFVQLPLSEKVESYGAVIGSTRMVRVSIHSFITPEPPFQKLFDQQTKKYHN